jgi:cellulose synthase/poly-beta-1,6-N-acetylglucosamine synthase-like glycosyltransferase
MLVLSLHIFNYLVFAYFLTLITIYLILNIASFKRILDYNLDIRYADIQAIFRIKNYIPVSLIVPAYNESLGIVESISSLLQLIYPVFQLIVVNDGSKDESINLLIRQFDLVKVKIPLLFKLDCQPILNIYKSRKHQNLVVIDKKNGGKADAINAGINIAKHPLITVIDADSILERDCLLKITRPFLEDDKVLAVGGTIRIANGCKINKGHVIEIGLSKSWLARFQVVEYLRAFLFGRTGFDVINGILIISGAFSCFKRDALVEIGGYKKGSIGEDMEIILRMHKYFRKINPKAKITFIPDPICWTEAPETFKILRRQRIRWQKGTLESILSHKELFMNYRYRLLGIIAFPYYVFYEALGPVVEIIGYIVFIISAYLGLLSYPFMVAFLSAAVLYGIVLSILSVVLEELSFKKYTKLSHLFILFTAAVFENFGYRQLNVWWRFKGMIEYLFGKRNWGQMEKKGFSSGN